MSEHQPDNTPTISGDHIADADTREIAIGKITSEIDELVGDEPARYPGLHPGLDTSQYEVYKTPVSGYDASKLVSTVDGSIVYETSALRAGGPTHDIHRYAESFRLSPNGHIEYIVNSEKTGISINSDTEGEYQDSWVKRMQEMLDDRQSAIDRRANPEMPVQMSEGHKRATETFGKRALRMIGLKR